MKFNTRYFLLRVHDVPFPPSLLPMPRALTLHRAPSSIRRVLRQMSRMQFYGEYRARVYRHGGIGGIPAGARPGSEMILRRDPLELLQAFPLRRGLIAAAIVDRCTAVRLKRRLNGNGASSTTHSSHSCTTCLSGSLSNLPSCNYAQTARARL